MWTKLITYVKKSPLHILIAIILVVIVVYYLGAQILKFYKWLVALSKSTGSTLTDEQAETIVNQLLEAFDTLQPYNYNAVKEPLLNLSTADFYKVKARFGHKYRGFVLGDVFIGFGQSFMAKSLDLNGWLVEELSNAELEDLRQQNPNLPI